MEQLSLSLPVALAIVALIRRPGVFSPALVGAECKADWPGTPSGEDEQLPETDRAPRRNWLPWGVAAVGAARLALFVTLHA